MGSSTDEYRSENLPVPRKVSVRGEIFWLYLGFANSPIVLDGGRLMAFLSGSLAMLLARPIPPSQRTIHRFARHGSKCLFVKGHSTRGINPEKNLGGSGS